MSEFFSETVLSGPLLLALPFAVIAGLVSFLSPCVLPLVPGYLSYMTGLSGTALDGRHARRRVLLGSTLFVLGFSAVFVSYGALFGGVGRTLLRNQRPITVVLGLVTIVLGLAFMGVLPWFNRELRFHRLPEAGLLGAPVLGVFFGIGWAPCIGPTLAAVLSLAYESASAGRGAILAFAYCLGLGVPFVVTGLAFRRALAAFDVVKRHYRAVTFVGGAFLVVIGLLQVTGAWGAMVRNMQTWITGFETAL